MSALDCDHLNHNLFAVEIAIRTLVLVSSDGGGSLDVMLNQQQSHRQLMVILCLRRPYQRCSASPLRGSTPSDASPAQAAEPAKSRSVSQAAFTRSGSPQNSSGKSPAAMAADRTALEAALEAGAELESISTPSAAQSAEKAPSQQKTPSAEAASILEPEQGARATLHALADLTEEERQDLRSQLDPIVAAQVCPLLRHPGLLQRNLPIWRKLSSQRSLSIWRKLSSQIQGFGKAANATLLLLMQSNEGKAASPGSSKRLAENLRDFPSCLQLGLLTPTPPTTAKAQHINASHAAAAAAAGAPAAETESSSLLKPF